MVSLSLIIGIGSQWQARSGPLVADRGCSGRPRDVLSGMRFSSLTDPGATKWTLDHGRQRKGAETCCNDDTPRARARDQLWGVVQSDKSRIWRIPSSRSAGGQFEPETSEGQMLTPTALDWWVKVWVVRGWTGKPRGNPRDFSLVRRRPRPPRPHRPSALGHRPSARRSSPDRIAGKAPSAFSSQENLGPPAPGFPPPPPVMGPIASGIITLANPRAGATCAISQGVWK
jgi:hypothetical protein